MEATAVSALPSIGVWSNLKSGIVRGGRSAGHGANPERRDLGRVTTCPGRGDTGIRWLFVLGRRQPLVQIGDEVLDALGSPYRRVKPFPSLRTPNPTTRIPSHPSGVWLTLRSRPQRRPVSKILNANCRLSA